MTNLFIYISYNIIAKSCACVRVCLPLLLCVCVCVCLNVAAGEEIDIHDALADIMSLNDWVNFFANNDNDSDFEYLTSTYTVSICMRKELQDPKLASTYLPGQLIPEYIWYGPQHLPDCRSDHWK